MKSEKRVFAIVIACIVVIVASIFVWRLRPVEAKMDPCDAEFTFYKPTQDGDKSKEKLMILCDNKNGHEYLIFGKAIIERDEN